MKILVRFGDNDFHDVMLAFGQLLINPIGARNWHSERLTKANIVRWFNNIAPTLYEMVQARDYLTGVGGDYLTIDESWIELGETEVNAKMDKYAEWGNGEAVLVDFGDEYRAASANIV